MKIPALLSLVLLLSLAILVARPLSAQGAAEYVFYGEDREEQRLGQTVLTDVDGYLNKSSYEGATCVERYNDTSSTTAEVHDQEDIFLAGARCSSDLLWVRRFYLSFDTSSLPDDAVINSVDLYLTKAEVAANESTARFEVLNNTWRDFLSLGASEWGSGTAVSGFFDPPIDDPEGTVYKVSLTPGGINKLGRTQFEVRLYDEAGETDFYGNFRENVLQMGRQRIFSSGDDLPQEAQPRLVVNATAGPPDGQPKLYEGWNKVFWSGSASSLSSAEALADINTQCGAGTGLAISRRPRGFLESFRAGYGGANFPLSSGRNYYILASKECVWDKL